MNMSAGGLLREPKVVAVVPDCGDDAALAQKIIQCCTQGFFVEPVHVVTAVGGIEQHVDGDEIHRLTGVTGEQLENLRSGLRGGHYSPNRMAAESTVVQSPRLSPTADWLMLMVRTILLEMR